MADVILIAAVVAFFVAVSLGVRALERMTAHSSFGAHSGNEAAGPEPKAGPAETDPAGSGPAGSGPAGSGRTA
jgi:hypothetical protein